MKDKRFDAFLVANIFSCVEKEVVFAFLTPFARSPLVTMVESIPGVPEVHVDNAAGIRDMVSYLASGKPNATYAVITGPEQNADSAARLTALRGAMESHNLHLDENRICRGAFTWESALEALSVLLDERNVGFDTLICFNDSMAMAAMAELERRGYRIPGDVRVTGFDNDFESKFVRPSLTTIEYPVAELGETSVDLLHELLTGGSPALHTELTTRFIPRLSSGELAAQRIPAESKVKRTALTDRVPSVVAKVDGWHSLSSERRRWLLSMVAECLKRMQSTETASVESFAAYLEQEVYADAANEWSYSLWPRIFDSLARVVKEEVGPEAGRGMEESLAAARYLSRAHENGLAVSERLRRETEARYLLKIGQDIGSTFDQALISSTIARYCRHLEIDTCVIVVYANPRDLECAPYRPHRARR